MIREIFLWMLSIWYLVITAVQYKAGLTWRLVLHDLRFGFYDTSLEM